MLILTWGFLLQGSSEIISFLDELVNELGLDCCGILVLTFGCLLLTPQFRRKEYSHLSTRVWLASGRGSGSDIDFESVLRSGLEVAFDEDLDCCFIVQTFLFLKMSGKGVKVANIFFEMVLVGIVTFVRVTSPFKPGMEPG